MCNDVVIETLIYVHQKIMVKIESKNSIDVRESIFLQMNICAYCGSVSFSILPFWNRNIPDDISHIALIIHYNPQSISYKMYMSIV